MIKASIIRLLTAPCTMALAVLPAHAVWAQQVPNEQPANEEPASEDRNDDGFFAEVDLGLRYDSAVAVDQLDVATREQDEALRARIRIGYEAALGEDTEVTVSYGLTQTAYEDFSEFDLQTHTLAAQASHDLGGARAGVSYRYIYARLDGDGLLNIHRVSPYVSGFVAKGLFVRGELLYSDSDFVGQVERDNEAIGGGVDLYWFTDRSKRYVSVGYDYRSVDAVDDQFDFNGHAFVARFSQKFPLGSDEAQFRAQYRYQLRDHTSITPQIGVEREDNRHRAIAEIEFPLNDWLGLTARYSYFDFGSNLESVDYSQSLVDVTLEGRF